MVYHSGNAHGCFRVIRTDSSLLRSSKDLPKMIKLVRQGCQSSLAEHALFF